MAATTSAASVLYAGRYLYRLRSKTASKDNLEKPRTQRSL